MSNEELAAEIQHGRNDLLPELWAQTRRFALSIANRFLNIAERGGMTRDDLLQEAFFCLTMAVNAYQGNGSFLAVYGQALNWRFCNSAGNTSRTRADPINNMLLSLDAPTGNDEDDRTLADTLADDGAPDMVARIEREELISAVRRAVEELPETERMVIILRFWRGYTLAETGQAVGMSKQGVAGRERSALCRLREAMVDW